MGVGEFERVRDYDERGDVNKTREAWMSESKGAGGIGFSAVLFMVFLVLKLVGVIGWKWVWVFAPLWLGVSVVVFIVILCLVMAKIFN